eukprot:PITA_20706
MPDEHLFSISVLSLWFVDIANYLVSAQFPLHLSSKEKSRIVRKSASFTWIWGNLFKLGLDQIVRRCVREEEVFEILLTCHDGPCGGHFATKRTAFKILQAGYYWPTLHQDVRRYISQCDQCQRMGKPTPRNEMPLQPQVTLEPFEKWDYLTKWAETKAIKAATEEKVAEFLRENIFYKFGYPRELVTDQGRQFTSNLIEYLLSHHKIKHRNSTPYHPQANGQVEVTNRALEGILAKVVSSSRMDWADHLVEATWAYNTTWKTTTIFTPYELVYGKKALLSIEFEYNTLRMAAQLDLDLIHAQQERLMQLNGLDELQMHALLHSEVTQLQRKVWHDRHLNDKQFQPGDWVLLYDSRHKDFKGKLRTRWLGPYAVEKCNDNGSVLIHTINEEAIPMLVNGHRLKIYRKPLSRQEFVKTMEK